MFSRSEGNKRRPHEVNFSLTCNSLWFSLALTTETSPTVLGPKRITHVWTGYVAWLKAISGLGLEVMSFSPGWGFMKASATQKVTTQDMIKDSWGALGFFGMSQDAQTSISSLKGMRRKMLMTDCIGSGWYFQPFYFYHGSPLLRKMIKCDQYFLRLEWLLLRPLSLCSSSCAFPAPLRCLQA